MCTLSWQYQADGLHLLFNRDEQLTRPIALMPEVVTDNGVTAIMPIDPQGSGTWLAVNERGQVWCLLNDYAAATSTIAVSAISRGLLVKQLAHCRNRQQQDALLQQDKLQGYAPFNLLLFTNLQEPEQWYWDGQQLKQYFAVRSPVSSSGRWPKLIPALRRWYWRIKVSDSTTAEQLLHLQRTAKPLNSFMGIAMQRATTQTVSTSYLHLHRHGVTFKYWDGHPREQGKQANSETALSWSQPCESSYSGFQPLLLPAVLAKTLPQVAAKLPRWQMRCVQHCLAERRLNSALQQLSLLPDQHFCDGALQYLGITPQVIACRWPAAQSRPVFICNHPTGGLDGLLLIALLQKRYPDLQVIANNVLLAVAPLAPFLVPVPVFAKSATAIPLLVEAFASEQPLLIFPAGRTGRLNAQQQVDDGVWARLAVSLSRRSQRALTLLHIDSRNSRLFYALAALRKWLRIDVNLEMLLLSREMLNPAIKQPKIFVDIPMHQIELEALADTDWQRAQRLKQRGMQLPAIYKEQQDAAGYTSCGRSTR
ncbi:hypothetical protein GCM10010919_04420 [Alishewanella longhuensis]|uniref:Putative acyltransferase ACT14924-like acyltransferase domain-containing protein n=1 Tax=Alishewanella longhuensis TaxID=1091037 RepID=A0ABQ3KTR4_9ALTE|nr:NRDE family protein [Alishewanella longhuensis]GHG60742.1 hypothetical protein GCM10010919_04420 [Alishewanella longhuensis]